MCTYYRIFIVGGGFILVCVTPTRVAPQLHRLVSGF